MSDEARFRQTVEVYRRIVAGLPPGTENLDWTAWALRGMHFQPVFFYEIPDFVRFTKDDLVREMEGILSLDDEEIRAELPHLSLEPWEFRLKQISMMIYYYRLLIRLRQDDPEAWDFVHELYEDD